MIRLVPLAIMILSFALIISVNLPSKKTDSPITSEEIRKIVREELKSELSNLEIEIDKEP